MRTEGLVRKDLWSGEMLVFSLSLSFLYIRPLKFDALNSFVFLDKGDIMIRKPKFQYPAGILSIIAASLLCYLFLDFIDYKTVALLLLFVVSVLAMLFDIWPVLLAAVLSALIWNFFFIPPRFTLQIRETDDVLMFLMYFLVAMVNAVLTYKIKIQEKKARDKEEGEKTIQLYNTLLNSLSHELKTPIATIIGAADTLNESEDMISAKNRKTLTEEIGIAGNRLNQQVENLLNMSRLESGMLKVKRDWCDLNELIHSVIHKLDNEAQKRIVYQTSDNLPMFRLDPGLLDQVIYNIVQNAIIHTTADKPVTIMVAENGESCQVSISDHGNGIPENELQHIFEKFYRIPGATSGGTGLGLSIAKGFTEAHGGTIKVENLHCGGAKFTIEIPAEISFLTYIKHE